MRRLIERPIRSRDTQDLLEGKVTAQELERRDKAKAQVKASVLERRLPINVNAEKPLTLAEQRAAKALGRNHRQCKGRQCWVVGSTDNRCSRPGLESPRNISGNVQRVV